MKRFTILLLTLLLLLFLTIPAGVALAQHSEDTVVEAGETIDNDVIVWDGNLEVAEGGVINGDVAVFNGDADIAGTVNGDLVLFNGNLEAENTAVISGDCVLLNGDLDDNTESGLSCTDVENFPNFIPGLPNLPNLPSAPSAPRLPDLDSFFGNLAETAGRSLLLGLLAFVVASFLPEHLGRVQQTVRRKPVASGAVGVLTAVAIPSLVALLIPVSVILLLVCIGLLGFPIMLALLLGLAAGALFGWITMGNILGEWLAQPLKLKNRSLPVTAALGTTALTFATGLLSVLPFVFGEGLITFLAVCVGLGATALTQFGAKSYPAISIKENEAKVTAVLETLVVEDTAEIESDR